jgi:hypothetical protein
VSNNSKLSSIGKVKVLFVTLRLQEKSRSREDQGYSIWIKPKEEWVKINVYGVFDSSSGEGGIGVVARDDMEAIVFTAWRFERNGDGVGDLEV